MRGCRHFLRVSFFFLCVTPFSLAYSSGDANSSAFTLPPDKLVKAKTLTHLQVVNYVGVTTWVAVAILLLLNIKFFARLRDWAAQRTARIWMQGLICIPVVLIVLALLQAPFDIYDHYIRHSYALSVQSWASWFLDWLKAGAINCFFGTIAASLAFVAIRRSPRRWWLWSWLGSIPFIVLLVLAAPLILDPLFYSFEPLQKSHPELVTQIQKVVARGGIPIPSSRMFLMKASEKETGINAYVTGFGPSARVVVWDNATQKATTDEVLWIFGHEMGHYNMRHVYLGVIFTSVLMLLTLRAADYVSRWLILHFSYRWDVPSRRDWASVGVYALVLTLFNYALVPIANTYSRSKEHEADVYGMEAMHGILPDPQATGIQTFKLLGTISLSDPNPSPLVVFFLYSHPSVTQRIQFVSSYNPWTYNGSPRHFSN